MTRAAVVLIALTPSAGPRAVREQTGTLRGNLFDGSGPVLPASTIVFELAGFRTTTFERGGRADQGDRRDRKQPPGMRHASSLG